jgi:glycerophosphoryl diester phosphodiesterase
LIVVLPAIYAHRLGRAYGPDSSHAALRRSLEQHVDGLETDCCLTADGELVLLHDPLLEQTSARSHMIRRCGSPAFDFTRA